MKKFISFLFVAMLLMGLKANATTTFEEAFSQSSTKPMLVLIYAQWADGYENCLNQFKAVENEFGDKFNYVELNIADKDTKSFNSRYHIYPNLPYVLMFRDGGKVSRYIPKNCASDNSCIIPKIKSFILQ